jgi:hypothetical protein
MNCLGLKSRPGRVRTDILFDDGGILEIYHLFKQGTETEGQWDGGETLELSVYI